MVIAKIEISGTTATVIWSKEIPMGLVGGRVQIEYTDERWNTLNKTVVFRGAVTKDVLDDGNDIVIPAEVLSRSGINFYVGVYGTDAENNIGIPTFWAKVGIIRDATDPNLDPNSNPDLPVWARLLERTPDWLAQPGSDNYILNRTHWSAIEKADRTFDGNLEGRTYHSIANGYTFVKITDQVLTKADLIGSAVVLRTFSAPDEDATIIITESMIQDGASEGYPALLVGEFVVSAYADFDIYGLHIEKGVYFLHYTEDGVPVGCVHSLSALPDEEEVVHKLDNKYLDAEWMANCTDGSEVILEEAVQPFSGTTAQQNFQFTLEAGKTYEVTWDNDVYQCIAGQISEEYIFVSYMGNAHLLEEEYPDTGEPFCIACVSIMGIQLMTQIASTDDATEHRIAIKQIGKIRNRIPLAFMPQSYVFPSDFRYTGVVDDELEKAYFHLMRGGNVYANYGNSRFKIIMIDLDLWDGMFHNLVMTNGDCIMMWSKETGWLKHNKASFMLDGEDGKKYRIAINSSGALYATDVTNQTIYA